MSAVLVAREPSARYLVSPNTAAERHFDLLVSAPRGTAQLRALLLTLAIQGKLVRQDPKDVPAQTLLKAIATDKARAQAARSRAAEVLAAPVDAKGPYDIPATWAWMPLGEVVDIVRGITFPASEKTKEAASGRIACLRTANVQEAIEWDDLLFVDRAFMGREEQLLQVHDIVMSMANSRELVGKVALVEQVPHREATFGGFLGVLRPWLVEPRYVMAFLRSVHARSTLIDSASQTTNIANISLGKLRPLLFPLPPLAEQARIVARVDELMRLCDALEEKGRLEAEQHARLLNTLLGTLTDSATPEELAANWQRVAEHFDLLLDRPEAVDAFEESVLELAVRGRLSCNGEPEVESAQAASLGEAGEQRYSLPSTWYWARLGELVENMGSGWSPACDEGERSDSAQWAVLRTTAVQRMDYRPREHKVIPPKLSPRAEIEVRAGDILITRAGPMNRVGVSCWVEQTPSRLMLSDKIVRFHLKNEDMLPEFVVLCLNAGWTKERLVAAKTGMAASQVNVSQADLKLLPIPVCKRAEQARIVARVTALRRLCADLRQRLQAQQTTQSRLAQALVEQATA